MNQLVGLLLFLFFAWMVLSGAYRLIKNIIRKVFR